MQKPNSNTQNHTPIRHIRISDELWEDFKATLRDEVTPSHAVRHLVRTYLAELKRVEDSLEAARRRQESAKYREVIAGWQE